MKLSIYARFANVEVVNSSNIFQNFCNRHSLTQLLLFLCSPDVLEQLPHNPGDMQLVIEFAVKLFSFAKINSCPLNVYENWQPLDTKNTSLTFVLCDLHTPLIAILNYWRKHSHIAKLRWPLHYKQKRICIIVWRLFLCAFNLWGCAAPSDWIVVREVAVAYR
jgi:hypothetical protein